MSPHVVWVGGRKTGRSYTDALGKPLGEPLHDAVLGAPRREANRVRDRLAAARAVRDHRKTTQAEEVRAAVGVGVELRAEPPCRRADERAAELAGHRRSDLAAQRVEQLHDRPLEQL